MFAHRCTSCTRRQLIFPSQITSMDNTDRGIVVRFTCWCGAEQELLTGREAERTEAPRAAVVAA